uniref:B-cell antigen receptor complex-associated protein beta chain n=2 Tax=Ornithorhynchus anatinus TaxID=9258 RepID=F6QER1_ORNAN
MSQPGRRVSACPASARGPDWTEPDRRGGDGTERGSVGWAGTMMPGLWESLLPVRQLCILLLLTGDLGLGAAATPGIPGSPCVGLSQSPRFVARKRGSTFQVACYSASSLGVNVSWYRQRERELEPQALWPDGTRMETVKNGSGFLLTVRKIQFEDNGVYYCRLDGASDTGDVLWGCGTELRVMGYSTIAELRRRNTLKDAIIMVQTLLIILFVSVPVFLLLDKDDSKTSLEDDHTYEGLDIDHTATYEDIVTLRTGEVKWTVGEHPGQE